MNDDRGTFRSHYQPRTRDGWIAVFTFAALFALAQPPLVYVLANRTQPWVLGMPFLYTYLLVVYVLLIGVLLWVKGRKL